MRKILLSLVFLAGATHAAILFGNRGLIPLRPLIANHFISNAGDWRAEFTPDGLALSSERVFRISFTRVG